MKKDEILKILVSLKDNVRRQYRAEIKGIFGSYVKGKAKKGSDIDILVDFNENADLFDLVDLSLFLERKLKQKVDIVPRESLRKEIRESVLREAVYI
ncbi:MAG: nucleotidyltransferase domain-containing protein [Candidatus Omnitrophota bacterium]